MTKTLHANFESFFEKPSRKKLQGLLQDNVGEFDHLDFKEVWPDFGKLARHMLAFSNSRGGALVIGVGEDTSGVLFSKGLAKFTDKVDIKRGVAKFLPEALRFDILDFDFEQEEPGSARELFQVMLVEDLPAKIPFVCRADGKGCRAAAIYVRNGTSSEEVGYERLQKILSRRIETQHSATVSLSLDEHLDQLEKLYGRIPRYVDPEDIMMAMDYPAHPDHPSETYEAYIGGLIERKKQLIEALSEKF